MTAKQREYLDFLLEKGICRGRGQCAPLAALAKMGLAKIQWIGPRDWAYTPTEKAKKVQ